MSLKNLNFGYLSKIEVVYLIAHLICLFLQFNVADKILILLLFVHSVLAISKNNIVPTFLLLILGSYQSGFVNIYTFEILGLNLSYLSLIFLFLFLFRNIKLMKIHVVILLPFLGLFSYAVIAGFFFNYSIGWYLNELGMFSIFFLVIIAVLGLNEFNSTSLLKLVFNYVVYFYPILTIFSILIADTDYNVYFDEFEKFYYVAIIPCMFVKFPKKFLIILLSITAFILKAKYTYTSSLNV